MLIETRIHECWTIAGPTEILSPSKAERQTRPIQPAKPDDPLDIESRIEDRIETHTEDVQLKQSTRNETYNRRTQVE